METFLEEMKRYIGFSAEDAQLLREVVAELHEADLGDLIAALDGEDRVSLVELTGADFGDARQRLSYHLALLARTLESGD